MAEIDLTVDPSKSTEPIRDLADQLEEVNHLAQETGKTFKRSFGTSTNSVDATTKAINDQNKAQKKTVKTTKDVKKEFSTLDNEIKDAYDDKPVDDYTKSVKVADKETESFSSSLSTISLGPFEGLKGGLDKLFNGFRGLKTEAKDLDDEGGRRGGLGSIIKKFGPIALGVAAVGAGLAVVSSKITEIDKKFDGLRGTVKSLFEVTGDEADIITTNIAAIGATFEQEINQVTLAANTLVKEFGISGEEATLLLSKGLNSSANIQGDLIDSVKEYSSQIRASGGDAEDLFKILERSGQEGIFSDKGVDVVKEFGLRIREQTEPTRDALESAFGKEFTDRITEGVATGAISSIDALAMISGELNNLNENSVEAQTVIADVFGGAGEDAGFRFLTLLENINDEQGFGNGLLSEASQRKQDTFEANQRLAAAQNELSKAIGDSSAAGRLWIEVQTFFVKLLVTIVNAVNELIESFSSLENVARFFFELAVPMAKVVRITDEYNASLSDQVKIMGQAQRAMREYGGEARKRINTLELEIAKIDSVATSDEERTKIIDGLNDRFPKLLENENLEVATTEELFKIKQKLTQQIFQEEIARKKKVAVQLLDLEITKRELELADGVSDERRKILEDEIEFLKTKGVQRIDDVEEEIKIELGLLERKNDEIIDDEELTAAQRKRISDEAKKAQLKIENDFLKSVQDILKRGELAFLKDLTVSQEERLKRQSKFHQEQLTQLRKTAEDLSEQLTGSRELDADVLDAFNRAQEQIEVEFGDKILKVRRDSNNKLRAEQLKFQQDVLSQRKAGFDLQIALIDSRLAEEVALINSQERGGTEKEVAFERRKQLEILDVQEFFLGERKKLIDEEFNLNVVALQRELDAIQGKEGLEFDLKRKNLDAKLKLLRQETDTQKAELDVQVKNVQDQISDLENLDGPTLGSFFDEIQQGLADAFGLTPEQLQAATQAIQQVANEIFNTIQQSLSDQISANDELINQIKDREQETKDALDREIENARLGYASNVAAKRKELFDIQSAEESAQAKRKELLARQAKLDTASQAISLVTASANLYKVLSPLPFGIGIALATLLTGAMITAFVASKSKVSNVTSLEGGGVGTDTGMITGKRHSQGGENFTDHVEVEKDEMFAVFNRKASRKYYDQILEFSNAVNTDSLGRSKPNTDVPDLLVKKGTWLRNIELKVQASVIAGDMANNMAVIPEIKEALIAHFKKPETIIYERKNGQRVMLTVDSRGNTKRTILS